MGWFRKKEEILRKRTQQERPASKKGKCKIKFKRNPDGSEEFTATPECTDAQIQLARRYRENIQEKGED
mgnify:CR=1 FL=1